MIINMLLLYEQLPSKDSICSVSPGVYMKGHPRAQKDCKKMIGTLN